MNMSYSKWHDLDFQELRIDGDAPSKKLHLINDENSASTSTFDVSPGVASSTSCVASSTSCVPSSDASSLCVASTPVEKQRRKSTNSLVSSDPSPPAPVRRKSSVDKTRRNVYNEWALSSGEDFDFEEVTTALHSHLGYQS